VSDTMAKWLDCYGHIPEVMRDFHDQKDIFKEMHRLYKDATDQRNGLVRVPTWAEGHTYVFDYFLWYMAQRGYTLQKSRKQFDFKPLK